MVVSAPYGNVALTRQAQRAARKLLEHFGYVGVLTIEFFVARGRLIANEMAPRVHNSGHWTIEGAATSQFENHLRAILGWPLGSTACKGRSRMLNLIGGAPAPGAVLQVAGAHLHDYGKPARPGRKVGHVTLTGDDVSSLESAHDRVSQRLDPKWTPALRRIHDA